MPPQVMDTPPMRSALYQDAGIRHSRHDAVEDVGVEFGERLVAVFRLVDVVYAVAVG